MTRFRFRVPLAPIVPLLAIILLAACGGDSKRPPDSDGGDEDAGTDAGADVSVLVSPTSGLRTTEAGGTDTITVALSHEPTANVTIAMISSDTTEGTVSPQLLTFTQANWNAPQVVTITGVDDSEADGDQSYTISTAPAGSTDARYAGEVGAEVSVTNTDDETAGISVSAISGPVAETGTTATFTIVLNSAPTADVVIALSSDDGTEATVSPSSVTFGVSNWNVAQTVTVTGVDDDEADGNVMFDIVTAAAVSDDEEYDGLNADDVAVENLDDESANIIVSAISGSTGEDGTSATFTVTLTSAPVANVTIAVSSGDPSEGSVAPASLTFTTVNWAAPQTVTVTGVDDDVADNDQTFTVVIAAAESDDSGYDGLDPADVTVTNQDNETPGISVSAISGDTSEGGASATFTVVLTSQPTASVTIAVSSDDTTEGTVSPAQLVFNADNWNAPQVVTATGVNDDLEDSAQSYRIVLAAAESADTNYNGINPPDVEVLNTDNDTAGITVTSISGTTSEAGASATFTIVLNTRPTDSVTLPISSSDTTEGTVSPASVTFTVDNWNSVRTITVTGVNDDITDGDQPYTVVIGAAVSNDPRYNGVDPADVSVSNIDNETPGFILGAVVGNTTEAGGTATFTIRLRSQPMADVVIGFTSSDLTEGTVSPASVTFTFDNWNAPRVITITGVNDAVADGNQTYSIVTAAAVSTDPGYNGLNPADRQVTNIDDETAGITVSNASTDTTEQGGTATLTIALNSEPTADVTIAISSSNTAEGTVAPASVTFTSGTWNIAQTITVTGIDDLVADGSQDYLVVTAPAVSTDPNYSGLNARDVAIRNLDDDTAGFIISPISGNTTEDGGTASFTVRLTSRPTANVRINLVSSAVTEGTVAPASVTFTNTNWNVAQTVTIMGVDDTVADGNQPYVIRTQPAVSTDVGYSGLNAPDVDVTNEDNDSVVILVTAISGPTTESGGTAAFLIALSTRPTANVTIALSSSDTSEGTVAPMSVTFTPSNWNSPRTITVTGVDDNDDDGDVAYSVTTAPAVSADSLYNGINPPNVAVTNLDND